MDKQYKWTVVIIVQKDKDSNWEYRELIKSIEKSKFDTRVKYMILHFDQDNGNAFVKTSVRHRRHFKIRIEKIKGSERKDFCLICKDDLGWFFEKYVKNFVINSQRSMLITWGHGVGLGFFARPEKHPTSDKSNVIMASVAKDVNAITASVDNSANDSRLFLLANSLLYNPPAVKADFKGIKSLAIGKKDTRGEIEAISASDIASVIRDTIGKDFKIDVFIANNCYMQMAEVCIDLAASFNMFVASQNSIPFAGVNYEKLFQYLPQFTELKLIAENIIDFFIVKYSNTAFGDQFSKMRKDFDVRAVSLSAIRLDCFHEAVAVINEVAGIIIKELECCPDFKSTILEAARAYCISDPKLLGSIDFEKFLVELIKRHELIPSLTCEAKGELEKYRSELTGQLNSLRQIKEQAILAILSPAKLHYTDSKSTGSISPLGFSVFYPSKVDGSISIRSEEIKDDLYFNSKAQPNNNPLINGYWGDFLKSVF